MNLQETFQNYWPILLIAIWFLYKQWNSKRVIKMLPELTRQGALEIDVRSPAEFAQANAQGTVNIPLSDIAARLDEIPRDRPVILCCASGTRSGAAKMILLKNGYKQVYNVGAWTNLLRA